MNFRRPHPPLGRALLAALACGLLALAAAPAGAGEDAAIKVLFLGDLGHHEPAKRCDWIAPVFAAHGIQATYSADANDLNPATLARYDVLLVYANIAAITPEQEKALFDFVEGGKGFAPIHCGSACFGNSPKAVALIGGRFKSHQTAVFAPVIIDHDHPIMKTFAGYEAWDETYVHAEHNAEGRTVLAERVDNAEHEPWTWVRRQGQGRVFYTASGHDERVWQHPGFQELLVRGVAWAAGAKGEALLASFANGGAAKKDRVPLTYEARPTVQNYEKRSPYPQYQFPLSPKDSQDYIRTEPGFELKLFAAEPDIVKPIALQWDHRGRLWVLETVDYPSTFTEQWQGHDRIVICEDTDGDGKADKFTVFVEGLNIATGMCFANGGVIVAQAPNLLFLKDTDGDDKADIREVIMPGWSKGDTHAGPSNLHYGFDNWIYGCVGYAGFDGTVGAEKGGQRQSFRQGPFRFTRAVDRLEFLGQYNNNTWGLGFNEAGELFGSTANNAHHFYTPIPIPYFTSTFGMDRDDKLFASVKIDAHYAAHPLTGKIRQVDVFGGFTAASGQNLYTARAFPEKYWDRCTLVCEPTMHLLHQGFLKRDGSGWSEDGDGLNLLAAEDEWVAPVYADVGPDGAVWIADWYNFIIQHNPTPSAGHGGFDSKTGNGGAHENPLRDTQHGRVWRLSWTGAKPAAKLQLDPDNGPQLVAALANDNLFWRLTAQRLLVERGKPDVVPALIELTKDQAVDKVGINGGVIHALWTLHGLGALDGADQAAVAAAVVALRHPSAAVRRTAVQVLPATADTAKALLAAGVLEDAQLNVRLAAFLAASKLPPSDELGAALFAAGQRPEVAKDRWLPSALTVAAAHHGNGYLATDLKAGIKLPVVDGGDAGDAGAVASLIVNGGFEEVKSEAPTGWTKRTYNGQAALRVVDGGRSGRCVEIASTAGADSSWFAPIAVKPHHSYRLSGWVKTRDVTGAMGALFNVHGHDGKTAAVSGTKDWTRLAVDFDSGDSATVDINCLFGGWGRSTGTAWYDDVAVTELGASSKSSGVATSDRERIVARNVGHRSTVTEQVALIDQLKTADAGLAGAILDGLAAASSEQERPKSVAAADRDTLAAVAARLDANNQRRLGALAERWGVREDLPGLAGAAPVATIKKDAVPPLPPEQQKRFDAGKARYLTLCIACHQSNGLGLPAVAPPLVGSEWVNGPESRAIRIVLGGVQGPIVAAGATFSLVMPPLRDALDDNAIAEILTYVRHEWGNQAAPVEAGKVKAIRAAEKARVAPWTAEELFQVP